MLLIVHQCFLMILSRKIIIRKGTLQTTNKFLRARKSQFQDPQITVISLRVLLCPKSLSILVGIEQGNPGSLGKPTEDNALSYNEAMKQTPGMPWKCR